MNVFKSMWDKLEDPSRRTAKNISPISDMQEVKNLVKLNT